MGKGRCPKKKRKKFDGISIKGFLTPPPHLMENIKGVTKIEKFFFAFLDELDHLEAKKKELIKLMENMGKFAI